MKSIVNILADDRFPRIRVGIGKPAYEDDLINYVIRRNTGRRNS